MESVLKPLFSGNLPIGLHLSLSSSPMLLYSSHSKDIINEVETLLLKINPNIKLLIVDSRQLLDYPSLKRTSNIEIYDTYSSIDFTTSSSSSYDKKINTSYVKDISIDSIRTHLPCIIYIENLDFILYDANFKSDHHLSTSSNLEDVNLIHMFAKALRHFMNDISDLNHNLIHQHSSSSLLSLSSSSLCQEQIYTISSTQTSSIDAISFPIKSLFPIIKTMDNNARILDEMIMQAFSSSSSHDPDAYLYDESNDMMHHITDEIRLELHKLYHGSKYLYQIALNDVRYTAMIRQHGQIRDTHHHHNHRKNMVVSYQHITLDDIKLVMNRMATSHGPSSSGSKAKSNEIASVKWSDIGGLDRVRQAVLNLIQLPVNFPQLFQANIMKKSGILLFGPPGTGKTLVAKAVATECGMAFLSIKGPELLDAYVGESEKNVREIFSEARQLAPCILFFDELDSLAPARGRGGDGGGAMDRVVSQLLTEMDRLGSSSHTDGVGVIIIGATNRPDLLDKSLLRPGRFDLKIFLSACITMDMRLQIIQATTKKFIFEDDVDLVAIADILPNNSTGADIASMVSSAYSYAMKRRLKLICNDALKSTDSSNNGVEALSKDQLLQVSSYMNHLPKAEVNVKVNQADFIYAAHKMRPSVTMNELSEYDALGKLYDDTLADDCN